MKKDLSRQYNGISKKYDSLRKRFNEISDKSFKNIVKSMIAPNTAIVDLACGNGDMISYFQTLGARCAGVDSSVEMTNLAIENTWADIRNEDFTKTSFKSGSFDLVTSKWAMQTSAEIDPIYNEAVRLLKEDGHLVFLVVHPIRQFIEKRREKKNYFKKEIVHSVIFDGAITVQEPSHTLNEYLSDYFLRKFSLICICEGAEFPAAEQIGGDVYPTYLIIVAQKK